MILWIILKSHAHVVEADADNADVRHAVTISRQGY